MQYQHISPCWKEERNDLLSQVPPGNLGPISLILNQSVLPSAVLASETLVM
jgi:hypothetical protein